MFVKAKELTKERTTNKDDKQSSKHIDSGKEDERTTSRNEMNQAQSYNFG